MPKVGVDVLKENQPSRLIAMESLNPSVKVESPFDASFPLPLVSKILTFKPFIIASSLHFFPFYLCAFVVSATLQSIFQYPWTKIEKSPIALESREIRPSGNHTRVTPQLPKLVKRRYCEVLTFLTSQNQPIGWCNSDKKS